MINVIVFIAKADANENINPPIAATRRTFFLPQVSARNPQICDENTIPRYDIALRKPCCCEVNFRSHFANGKI